MLETFELANSEQGTEFVYEGELGTDAWQLAQLWGTRVAQPWEQTVADSLQSIKAEAERRAGPRSRS